ncbi:MAG: hypothetical protein M3314_12235 [Actinomycetota bacterium]|nr:hypothetical protein [Actinomycetota bacterium]
MRSPWVGRAVVAVALVLVGVAAFADNDDDATAEGGAAITVGATRAAGIGADGEQQVIPAPLAVSGGQAGGVAAQGGAVITTRRPPVPNLDSLRPTPPPNTVSLEELHQRGETHVLR